MSSDSSNHRKNVSSNRKNGGPLQWLAVAATIATIVSTSIVVIPRIREIIILYPIISAGVIWTSFLVNSAAVIIAMNKTESSYV